MRSDTLRCGRLVVAFSGAVVWPVAAALGLAVAAVVFPASLPVAVPVAVHDALLLQCRW